ncbi:hypothetical protein [Goodfellowiella coeruleoviolacea]|uniref:hypothetical protein n=1 Tax=Goodfellowiella coeruleoviolacea TaxID=334858 RepID=UPI0020A5EC57|nr:hypothetical protein [Goodfellowiella coeruleoviolacea]
MPAEQLRQLVLDWLRAALAEAASPAGAGGLDQLPGVGGNVVNELGGQADIAAQLGVVHGNVHIGPKVALVVTGEPGSATAQVLRSAIAQADAESSAHQTDNARAPGAAVVVDAPGKTAADVVRHLAGRLAIDPDGPEVIDRVCARTPPLTVVLDGVDDAAEPEELVTEVLTPLVQRGVRFLLGFRRPDSPALTIARTRWSDPGPGNHASPQNARSQIARSLAALAERVADVADREVALHRHHQHVAARIAAVPRVGDGALSLRLQLRLTALRQGQADQEPDALLAELAAAEAAVVRALRRVDEHWRELDQLLDRRRDLFALLDAVRAKAAALGLAEDTGLDSTYRRAHEALTRTPCDLVVSEQLVNDYQLAVRAGGVRAG